MLTIFFLRSRQFFIILSLLIMAVPPVMSQSKSAKKGLAYGGLSVLDMDSITQGVSWWYNWSPSPDTGVAGIFIDKNIDFVPMAWNGNPNMSVLENFYSTHPNAKYLLGFNEPNATDQANMTPSQAANVATAGTIGYKIRFKIG